MLLHVMGAGVITISGEHHVCMQEFVPTMHCFEMVVSVSKLVYWQFYNTNI